MMKNVHVGWGPVGMTRIRSSKTPALELNTNNLTLELNSEYQLSIVSEYEGEVVWKSSNENVIKIDKNGKIVAVGYGSAYITVTAGEMQGICIILVPEPIIEPDPDEPTSKLDNTKLYYGTIKSPTFMKFTDLTEDEVVAAVESGSLVTAEVAELHTVVNIATPGDAVVVLIPTTEYKAVKQANKVPFQETFQVYEGTGANGNVKLNDFYVYGEILMVSGNLEVHVE